MTERERVMCAGLLAIMQRWVEDGCPDGKEEPRAKALDGTAEGSEENDALRRAS